jgi:parallel beta-helix repeat protein
VQSVDDDGIDAAGVDLVVSKNHVSFTPDDSPGLSIDSDSGALIEGNVVEHTSEHGLNLAVSLAIIRKNKVSHCGCENESGINLTGDDNTVEQNTVSACDSTGILVKGSGNDLIGNKVSGCTVDGIGVLTTASEDTVLDGNSCTSNEGQGINNGGTGTQLSKNKCHGNLLDVANQTGAGATIVDQGGNSFGTGGFTTEPLAP